MKKILLIMITFAAAKVFAQKQIIVAQDGSGNYTSVQSALDAIPSNNNEKVTVYIKKGIYKERIIVDATKK